MLAFTFQCVSFSLGAAQLKKVRRLRLKVRKWIRAPLYDITFLQCSEAMTFPARKIIRDDNQAWLAPAFVVGGIRPALALASSPLCLGWSFSEVKRENKIQSISCSDSLDIFKNEYVHY